MAVQSSLVVRMQTTQHMLANPSTSHRPSLPGPATAGDGGCLGGLQSLHLVSLKLVNPIPPAIVRASAWVGVSYWPATVVQLRVCLLFATRSTRNADPPPACYSGPWPSAFSQVWHAIRKPACMPLLLTIVLLDRSYVQWPALAPGLTSLVWHDIRKPDGWDAAFAHVAALEAQVEPMEGAQLFQASLKLAVL